MKVAVIGCGSIAKKHLKNLRYMFPNGELISQCTRGVPNNDVLKLCDRSVTDINEIDVADLSFAVLATPVTHRMHYLNLFSRARVPVLMEKPAAFNYSSYQKMIALVRESRSRVAIGYCMRFLSSATSFKSAVNGALATSNLIAVSIRCGQYLPTWRPGEDYVNNVSARKDLGGGPIFELSHEIDYVRWIFGQCVLKEASFQSLCDLQISVPDTVELELLTEAGISISMNLNFCDAPASRYCIAYFSDFSLEWNLLGDEVRLRRGGEERVIHRSGVLPHGRNYIYLNMYKEFIAWLSNGIQSDRLATLEDVRGTQELIEAAHNIQGIDFKKDLF